MIKIYKCSLKKNNTNLILSNGSERGDFVPVDYIFSQMNKIHDGIQIMKTYYPHDEAWNTKDKISENTLKKGVNYAWDFEYEDYHPFDVFEDNSKTINQFKQAKLFGSDIYLTLTMNLSLSDDEIKKIVEKLVPYGRIFLRINHESNGTWFRYNKFNTYKEVNDFFVRCHKIIKNNSTNIFTVFNVTGDFFVNERVVRDEFLHLANDELKESLNIADYWSIDKYVSLNFGWPFEEMSEEKKNFFKGTIDDWWILIDEVYIKLILNNNLKAKKIFITEFNADATVDGYEKQAEIIKSIYSRLSSGHLEWIKGIVMYQFRDHGGLGLEKGNLDSFERLPALNSYIDVIKKFKHSIIPDLTELNVNDYIFNWENSDSIRGLKIDDIYDKKKITNKTGYPIFIMYGDEQTWQRLEPNASFLLNHTVGTLYIFIPPFEDKKNGQLVYSKMIRNIKEIIQKMFE